MAVELLTAFISATEAAAAERSLAFCLRGITKIKNKEPLSGFNDCHRGFEEVFPGATKDLCKVVQDVGERRGMLPLLHWPKPPSNATRS
jgi:hypothetical protein